MMNEKRLIRPPPSGIVSNRVRPKCPDCGAAMAPVFRVNARGGITRVRDAFYCVADDRLARGRRKVRFV